MSNPSPSVFSRRAKDFFIWLSGASSESLSQCPAWEQRKYVAFGATVLVPSMFALIAASYAVSTLTKNLAVIIPITLAWAFIILSIDRALLATYRSFQPKGKKLTQFGLRFLIAMLMGLTISHPLALLLFQDRIAAQVETERGEEIQEVRQLVVNNLAEVENKIAANEKALQEHRKELQSTFETKFLDGDKQDSVVGVQTVVMDEEVKAAMNSRIKAATDPMKERIAQIDEQMATTQEEYSKLKEELDHWQKEFEREVNGQRSGIVGVGPRAKSIQTDQLEWRRAEAKRLASTVEYLSSQRNQLSNSITSTDREIRDEYDAAAASRLAELKAERERVAAMKRQAQEEQMDDYLGQQVVVRQGLEQQIEASLGERDRLQEEMALITAAGNERIAELQNERRADLLTQTLALHSLFKSGSEGGFFALTAYLVLTLLFLTVDTIPIVVKYFSAPGPYDNILKLNEECYSRASHTESPTLAPIDFELRDGLDFGQLITRKAAFERWLDLEREKIRYLREEQQASRAATLSDMEARFNIALSHLISAQLVQATESAQQITAAAAYRQQQQQLQQQANTNGHDSHPQAPHPQAPRPQEQAPDRRQLPVTYAERGNGEPHANGNGGNRINGNQPNRRLQEEIAMSQARVYPNDATDRVRPMEPPSDEDKA